MHGYEAKNVSKTSLESVTVLYIRLVDILLYLADEITIYRLGKYCHFQVAIACASIDFGVIGYMTLWDVKLVRDTVGWEIAN